MIKRLWSYWAGSPPNIVHKSIQSWKKYLPDWEITILNEKTIDDYPLSKPASFDDLSRTTQSDVVRLSILYLYGGVWIDASTILNENLDWLQEYTHYPFYGFNLHRDYIESWFIFVPKKRNELILMWLKTLNSILDTSPYEDHPAYNHMCSCDKNDDKNDDKKYFMIYEAYCYLVNTNPAFARAHGLKHENAEKYLWSPWHSMENTKLTKLTKEDRAMHRWLPFPTIYILIIIGVVIGIGIIYIFYRLLYKKKSMRSLSTSA